MNFKKFSAIVLNSVIILSIFIPPTLTSCPIAYGEEPQAIQVVIDEPLNISLPLPEETDGAFKTYMDYRTITNKNSIQYQMQTQAFTDSDGFRIYDDCYMVAVGTAYAQSCGVKFDITLEDGTIIHCITGDIKSDAHTDSTNRFIPHNGNIVEFIVDTKKLSSLSRKMGDISYSGLHGGIIKIEVIN